MCWMPFPTVWKNGNHSHDQYGSYWHNQAWIFAICSKLYALENKLSTDPPNKVEVEKDGTRTELKFNKETVIETVIKTDIETDIVSALGYSYYRSDNRFKETNRWDVVEIRPPSQMELTKGQVRKISNLCLSLLVFYREMDSFCYLGCWLNLATR